MYILHFFSIIATIFISPISTGSDHEAEVNIFSLTVKEWDSNVKSTFEDKLIEEAKGFCTAEDSCCGLKSDECNLWEEITKEHISFGSDPPEIDAASLIFKVALQSPKSRAEYIEKEITTKIIKKSKEKFENDSGYKILKINEERFKLSPPNQINIIITIISALVFIVMLAILLILIKRDNKKSHTPNYEHMSSTTNNEKA